MKSVLVLRHLAFEDLGRLQPALEQAGYGIRYIEAGVDSLAEIPPLEADLVIILGGPISVYDTVDYPWLDTEIAWLRARLLEDQPTLGICLGAQLMAAALQAKVYAGSGKEIGWGKLVRGRQSDEFPGLEHYIDTAPAVLHWHGDTFDLPSGARHLASSPQYENQAFAWGQHCLALQFHPEFDALKVEQWLIGHCLEIASTPGISVAGLRADAARHGAASHAAADEFFKTWLASLRNCRCVKTGSVSSSVPHRCVRNF
jgi:GMP synthase (glutamine-hydrolysing)